MKVISVVTLFLSLSAILGCGHGVPTQDSATVNKTEAITDENKNAITPVTNVSGTDLNPPHGKPGHRCDIAVGQPLNSKPATQPAAVINPVTTATTPTTKPTTTVTAPSTIPDVKTVTNPAPNLTPTTQSPAGLNPAHGQPGHRCDIQVGQPLNSKPLKTTPTTTPLPTLTTPTTPNANNTTTVAPGMNPRHGQPGHRCDILVGQPLNSKPAQTSTQTTPITP